MRGLRVLAVAVAGLVLMTTVTGCGGLPVANPATSLPDCSHSVAFHGLPAFAIGINAQGHLCWETQLPAMGSAVDTPLAPAAGDGMAFVDSSQTVVGLRVSDGRRRWQWKSGALPATSNFPGGSVILTAANGRVMVQKLTIRGRSVVGLDDTTGSVRWTESLGASRSSPVLTGDGGLAITSRSGAVTTVIEDTTGRVRWHRTAPASSGLGGTATRDTVSVAHLLIEQLTNGAVTAVRPADGTVAWSRPGPVNAAQAVGNLLLLTPEASQANHFDPPVTAVDPTTGRTLWTYTPFGAYTASTFYAFGGDLVETSFGSQGGTYGRLDPVTGKTLWQVQARVLTVSAVDGLLIDVEVAGQQPGPGTLVARDPATGAVRWQSPVPTVPGHSPYLAKLYDIGGTGSSTLAEINEPLSSEIDAFDPSTGAHRWTVNLPTQVTLSDATEADGGLILQGRN